MRKFPIFFASLLFFLILPLDLEVNAESDPNVTVEENLKKPQNQIETEESPLSEINDSEMTDNVSITIWDYVKMILALGFVILLLYGLLRFVNSRNKTFQQNQLIQNLGGVGLSQGKSAQLLQVGNSLILVGIGEDITVLKEITDPAEIEILTKIYEDKQDIGKAVPYIAEIISRLKREMTSQTKNNDKKKPTFDQVFQTRLQEVKKDRSEVLKDWKTKEREKNE
ncbi:flagellar protein FliO/FliZ [Psychrobacillus insolitus]|uniref:Flagellar protein FliO/FliZ n=2 Tax=Psychrobacillus insolitus TaxID=1461 RepID=A0A2W7MLX0_9BACI|nr:flagellar protein FliO/FliZ [Psychrobacillus insolitus]